MWCRVTAIGLIIVVYLCSFWFIITCIFVKPATSDYIVRDTGNCSPRYMRCTINQVIINCLKCSNILLWSVCLKWSRPLILLSISYVASTDPMHCWSFEYIRNAVSLVGPTFGPSSSIWGAHPSNELIALFSYLSLRFWWMILFSLSCLYMLGLFILMPFSKNGFWLFTG